MEWKAVFSSKNQRQFGHKKTVTFKIIEHNIFLVSCYLLPFLLYFFLLFFSHPPSQETFSIISLRPPFSSLLWTGIKWHKTSSLSLLSIFSLRISCCLCLNTPKLIFELRGRNEVKKPRDSQITTVIVTLDNEGWTALLSNSSTILCGYTSWKPTAFDSRVSQSRKSF